MYLTLCYQEVGAFGAILCEVTFSLLSGLNPNTGAQSFTGIPSDDYAKTLLNLYVIPAASWLHLAFWKIKMERLLITSSIR